MPKQYGKWKVLGGVGQGGQAHVFLVADSTGAISEQRVLKRLINVNDPARKDRFKQEVEATQAIQHTNVLRVYESHLDGEEQYYIAEYCDGGSLQKNGAQQFRGNVRKSVAVIMAVSEALLTAHGAGIIHRDVKPSNILFRRDGTPVIGDFGICYVEDGARVTLSDEAMGSVNYIAPEMESGGDALGGPTDQTDVYSLGKVLFWMLSGGKIFAREAHRNFPLTTLFADQRFEHVHTLLDRMVVHELAGRLHSDELREELRMTNSLTEGGFAPLKPSIGIQCRFCGVGQYQKFTEPNQGATRIHNTFGWNSVSGADVRTLRCSYCGHVEVFQFAGIQKPDWWEK